MKRTHLLAMPFVSSLFLACASVDIYVVKGTGVNNILGAQFRVCESKIRFQGTEFTVEGLVGPSKGGAETKSFQVAKIGITAQQAVNISNVALALDSLQKQTCETTRDFTVRATGYEEYVKERDARFERIIVALSQADTAIKGGVPQDKVTATLAAEVAKK